MKVARWGLARNKPSRYRILKRSSPAAGSTRADGPGDAPIRDISSKVVKGTKPPGWKGAARGCLEPRPLALKLCFVRSPGAAGTAGATSGCQSTAPPRRRLGKRRVSAEWLGGFAKPTILPVGPAMPVHIDSERQKARTIVIVDSQNCARSRAPTRKMH